MLKTALEKFIELYQSHPDQIYLNQPIQGKWHRFTYQRVHDEAVKIAHYLQSLNLPRGSKIAIVSKNCAHWIITDLAIMMCGHVSVPLYPNINGKTVQYVLNHSDAKVLFVGKLDAWHEIKSGIPSHIQTIAFPEYGPKELKAWDAVLNADFANTAFQPIQANEMFTIIYTSGTTGNPKGVMLSMNSASYTIENALTQLAIGNSRHRQFSYLPLSHIAERMFVEVVSLWLGSEIWFAESLDLFVSNLQTAKPTIFIAVPRIWTKFQMGILAKLPQKKLDLLLKIPVLSGILKKKIKTGLGLDQGVFFFTGAAPIANSLLDWYQKLDMPIQEVYGMTENCAYSHFTRQGKHRTSSVGTPMPSLEVRFGDRDEIQVKSPANMLGYYHEPELTAAALQDGWLYTGDTGHADADGYLTITGRVKEIFKTDKAKYVSPSPIEMMLCKSTEIEQVCVVGANLPQPIALIVLSADAKKNAVENGENALEKRLHTLLTEVNQQLESHEQLKKLVMMKDDWTVENNLLTPSMKIKRNVVEGKYSSQFQNWYSDRNTVIWE
jgi:long-chain acyl-CoA synthetase